MDLVHAVVMAAPEIRVLEPEFNPVPSKLTYTQGDMARLLCSVSHLGERTIVWRKLPNPNPLTIGLDTWVEDRRLHVEHVHKHNQWNLIIEHVTSEDEGDYECQVSRKERSLRQVVTLEVIDVPVKRNPDIVIRGNEFVSRGGMIALLCNVTSLSDNNQNLQWVKDGNILTWRGYGGRISIVTRRSRDSPAMSSLLRVRDVTADDAGDYTCRSSDLTHMTTLRVAVTTEAVPQKAMLPKSRCCRKRPPVSVRTVPDESFQCHPQTEARSMVKRGNALKEISMEHTATAPPPPSLHPLSLKRVCFTLCGAQDSKRT
ncbi:zwei Ig domain protein zig-8-like [Babylonia areolata]|uniref:zwei Ig domain protein zig-8-like n=1 Tax=Babylonia areolata TaxID=304850 RepID=UPI003FD530E9